MGDLVQLEGKLILGKSQRFLVDQYMRDFDPAEFSAQERADLRNLMERGRLLGSAGLVGTFSAKEMEQLTRAGVFGGAGFVDTIEQAVLNGLIQDGSWAGYATLYFSLSSTTPTEAAGNFTEPSGGAYARVSTVAADWDAATGTAPATKTTGAVKTFPTATADWVSAANLTHFGLHDASTAGNLVVWGALGTAKPVLNGDTASLAAGAPILQLGDPGDTY